MFEIKLDIKGLDDVLRELDHRKVVLATHSALNKTAQQARTLAAGLISREYNIQPSRVNKFLRISMRSRGSDFTAVITGTGMGLGLGYFGARQVGVSISKRDGFRYNRRAGKTGHLRRGGAVSVEVKRGSRKLVSGSPKPFMAILNSGHVGVFQRTGRERLPVQQLFGPGIGGLFGSKKINEGVTDFVNENFWRIFPNDLKWRLEK